MNEQRFTVRQTVRVKYTPDSDSDVMDAVAGELGTVVSVGDYLIEVEMNDVVDPETGENFTFGATPDMLSPSD